MIYYIIGAKNYWSKRLIKVSIRDSLTASNVIECEYPYKSKILV